MDRPEYDTLIVCNNDLLIPTGTVRKLAEALHAGWAWVLPMTSHRGTFYAKHRLGDYFPSLSNLVTHCNESTPVGKVNTSRGCIADPTDQPLNYQRVQDALDAGMPEVGGEVVEPIRDAFRWNMRINGYMMAFNKHKMARHQHNISESTLFNPDNVNVGNEDALARKMHLAGDFATGIHTGCFVYHHKGYTLHSIKVQSAGSVPQDERNAVAETEYLAKD